jgi:hypothetical protein
MESVSRNSDGTSTCGFRDPAAFPITYDELASDIRKKAPKAWRKPARLAFSMAGAVVNLTSGHPWLRVFP